MNSAWLKAAGVRALKSFAQTLLTLIGASAVNIVDIKWAALLGVAATVGVLSVLTSIVGLPEAGKPTDTPPEQP